MCLSFCVFMCILVHLVWCVTLFVVFFFFKQKTAYEMRISDWSSDVCSSDLPSCARQSWVFSSALPSAPPRIDKPAKARKQGLLDEGLEIGRASCRERVCQYV